MQPTTLCGCRKAQGVPLSMRRMNTEYLRPNPSDRSAIADVLLREEPDEEEEEEDDSGGGENDDGDEGYSE